LGTKTGSPLRLTDVLGALPQAELDALIARLGVRIDPAKRLDVPAQVARALVQLPDLRDPSRLPPPSVELLHRVAEANGILFVTAVPAALEPLSARGMVFARGKKGAIELILPIAYLVQLRSWEGEDPRGLRALLAQAPFETASAVAAHYLGRPATPPISLSLEAAWEFLGNTERLAEEIGKLAPTERRVLEGVEDEGGEVETDELLELEREPLRLRTAQGPTQTRRGVGFSLERRGFLVPVHPNRHVVPTEVARIIGAVSHEAREQRRREVKTFAIDGDHAPRRARFTQDPGPLAVGLALAAREPGSEIRPNIGTPKSLVQKLATRFGRDPSHVALLVALSRAIGLWDAGAVSPSGPPGSHLLGDLSRVLFDTWLRGGAWDEARPEAEVLRVGLDARDGSPVGVVREVVLEALRDLGEDWLPASALTGYLKSDHRLPGLTRLFRRWGDRVGVEPQDPADVAGRILKESLPALGVIDLGEESADDVPLRLTPRGRALVNRREVPNEDGKSKFLDTHVLRVGAGARIAAILSIAPFVEVGRIGADLDLLVAPQTLARALSAGFEADVLRQRIEAIAPLPESLSRTLEQASVVLGRGSFAPANGFLWVEDANIRELLRTAKSTQELFVDPSPPSGLLVQPGVDVERLARRCRTVGVEVISEGNVVRARTVPPPPVMPRSQSSSRALRTESSRSMTPPPRNMTPPPRKKD
jgi:hypothetical protein